MKENIHHIIVLMLENRSFDHMLGFLNHPNAKFKTLTGTESNRLSMNDPAITVSNDATGMLALGPNHSHDAAITHITGLTTNAPPYTANNRGFLLDYEEYIKRKKREDDHGKHIMKCMDPLARVPALATLALEFGVCTRWHCSVPGETWPNRNFAHTATSGGEVNINTRFYRDQTIFEILEDARQEWAIYHDGIAQTHVFPALWISGRRGKWGSMNELVDDILSDNLPEYSFVEPKHFGGGSNSQHPNKNQEVDEDFRAGEDLIRRIYQALIDNEAVWRKTLFVITYDEHGGFYDRMPPPNGPAFGGPKHSDSGFDFQLLGPRVPAVLVSPYIAKGTVDSETIYDHSSIFSSVKDRFAPDVAPRSQEIRKGATFWGLLNPQARSLDQVPESLPIASPVPPAAGPRSRKVPLDESQQALLWVAGEVEKQLKPQLPTSLSTLMTSPAAGVRSLRAMPAPRAKPKAISRTQEELTDFQDRFMKKFRKEIPHRVTLRAPGLGTLHNPTILEVLSAAQGLAQGSFIRLKDTRKNILAIHAGNKVEFQPAKGEARIKKVGKKNLDAVVGNFLTGKLKNLG